MTRGGIWNAAANLTPQLCALAISIAGARFLGPSGLGRQSFIAFVVTTSMSLFTVGVPVALMRTVGESVGAERRAEARGLVEWAWRIGVILASVARSSDRRARTRATPSGRPSPSASSPKPTIPVSLSSSSSSECARCGVSMLRPSWR